MVNANRYYKTPFAQSGNKAEVPNVSVGGAVAYDTGFGPDYELPQGQLNRKRIERDMYNGMHFGITGNLKQWQEKVYPTWIEDDGLGAAFLYPKGMIVNHSGQNWISNENANQEEPGVGLKWSVLEAPFQKTFDSVSEMIAATWLSVGTSVQTLGYYEPGDGGGNDYKIVAAATGVDDGGEYIDLAGSGLQAKAAFNNQNIASAAQFGAKSSGFSDSAFIAAARYLLSKEFPGGTILVDGVFTINSGTVNFWDILAAAQDITPADNYLPNGELVRGTYIGLQGFGYERSKITFIGAGDGFVWGNFTAINDKRAMSGRVDGIDFRGDGAVGHASQTIIDNGFGQSYSTVTNAFAGTTNTTTRALVFEECVPNTFVTNCRFRYLQEAIHQTYGFGFVGDTNDIQFCNIGYFFDVGVTTWEVRSGNEIEVCAVGVFSKNTSNGKIGAAVIEANIAGCDVLIWISKFLSMDGTWFEGSNKNVVMVGDLTAPSLPNSGIEIANAVGLNVENNGGLVNFTARNCAMNNLGESFSVNGGEKFYNIKYDNCTLNEGPFDASSVSVSGIADISEIKVIGRTINGSDADFSIRQLLEKIDLATSSSNTTSSECFVLLVDNEVTSGRIEIEGFWKSAPENDFQMYTFKYVGVLSRSAGNGAIVSFLSNESITTLYPATGTNIPSPPNLPDVTVSGLATGQQEVSIAFARGTAVSQTANTFYKCTIMNATDAISFK